MASAIENEFDGFRLGKFDIMPQIISEDWRLSPQTKWILVYLLNRKNWKLRVSHFVSMHKDSDSPVSEKSVYRSLKALIECGYMTRTRLKEGNRFTGIKYTLLNPDAVTVPERETPAELSHFEHAHFEHVQVEDVQNGQILHNTDLLHKTDYIHNTEVESLRANSPAKRTEPKNRKGSRLPLDWMPSLDMIDFAIGLGLDAWATADSFRDYWIAVPGSKGSKLDWPATWRNWCRNEAKRSRGKAPTRSRQERVADAWAGVPDIEGV